MKPTERKRMPPDGRNGDNENEKRKEYFDLSLEVGCLHDIETDQLLDFAIELFKEIKL